MKKVFLPEWRKDFFARKTKNGRGGRNRTRINGFGDRRTAVVLHPCIRSIILAQYFIVFN